MDAPAAPEQPPEPAIHPSAATVVVPQATLGALLEHFPGHVGDGGALGLALAAAPGTLEAPPGGPAERPDGMDEQPAGGMERRPAGGMDEASAVALAKTLLPTIRHQTTEYNLPVLHVQRSQVHDVENMESVDWDTIQIVETHDEEGRINLMSEGQMCELLGLTDRVTTNIPAQGFDCRMDEERNDNDGAAIPTNDVVPCEVVISYDKNNPSME
ncbi:unnamed protein product, partial [Urochloa humidicola]